MTSGQQLVTPALASPLCHGHLVVCSSVTPSLHHSRLSCQRGGHHNPPRIAIILSQPQYRSLIITQLCLSYLNCSLLAFAPADRYMASISAQVVTVRRTAREYSEPISLHCHR
eukprot:scpid98993/ scgid0427/ 